MQLKHLNLATSDVGGLALFFERYFGFKRLAARGQDAFALMCNQFSNDNDGSFFLFTFNDFNILIYSAKVQ